MTDAFGRPNGLVAGRRLTVPIFGSYHTAYEENIRRRVEKLFRGLGLPHRGVGHLFDRLTWNFVTWFFNHMQRLAAPSRHTRDTIARRFRSSVGLFSRGVDTAIFSPRFRREPPRTTALFVGRLVVDKNLEALVEIFTARDDVHLVVVGNGPERPWLAAALPDVTFTGHLSGEALSTAYASADLFVFPSETETFGNVVLEAMASGLPVVTSDRVAPQELVEDGVSGYAAPIGAGFRRRVEELLRNGEARRRMGEAARRFAATRSWTAVFEALLADYRTVLDRSETCPESTPPFPSVPVLVPRWSDAPDIKASGESSRTGRSVA
jgi:glycosyltransferase involved in cell wall biosynthesis